MRPIQKFLTVLAICSAAPALSHAAPAKSAHELCLERATIDTEVVSCHRPELRRLEAELAAALKSRAEGLSPSASSEYSQKDRSHILQGLRQSQQAWKSYRDAHCAYALAVSEAEAQDIGSSEANALNCKIKQTQQRIELLNSAD